MNIDKYEFEEGYRYPNDDTGCHYDDAESLILTGMLGWCGCGAPDAAGQFLLKILKSFDDYHAGKITWQQRDALISDEGIRYFVYYVIAEKDLTEHGTSVNGSWLTDKGREIMEDLESIYTS